MRASTSFATISDKLAKLIPRLASNHAGEVTATVAAIGRTLVGVGLDWHDLAQRAAAPSLMDALGVPTPEPSRSAPAPPPSPAKPPQTSKPQREPSPWPTWSTLTRFGRLAMMDEMREHAAFTPAEEVAFAALYKDLHGGQCLPARKEINLFNRASRNLWERGWRLYRKAA